MPNEPYEFSDARHVCPLGAFLYNVTSIAEVERLGESLLVN